MTYMSVRVNMLQDLSEHCIKLGKGRGTYGVYRCGILIVHNEGH